tara:strand:+ start:270 stop:476 length:207 start_codon:yes stop_codon:yes gene_type:complete
MKPQDPQVRTNIAKENIKDIIADASSSLSSDKPLLLSDLINIINTLVGDLQVEIRIAEIYHGKSSLRK